MGLLRVLLALGVITEHAGHSYFTGSYSAVQIFFMISGFYMALILSSGRYRDATRFYASRITRLFPVYWVAVFLGLGFAWWVSGKFSTPTVITDLARILPGLWDTNPLLFAWTMLANSFLITADFSWLMQGIDVVRHPTQLLVQPPVWTLALELYFYALCPWLIRVRSSVLFLLMGLALAARVVGYLAGLDANPYHARFFPFEIFFFIAGILTYRLYANQRNFLTTWLCGHGGVVYGLIYLAGIVFFYDLVKLMPGPVLYGGIGDYLHSMAMCMLAVPAIIALFAHTRTSQLDLQLGELSYPLYVVHYGFVSTLLHTKIVLPYELSTYWTILTLTVLTAILLHVLIQRPMDRWREQLFVTH